MLFCYSKSFWKKKIKIVILSRPSKNLQQDINRMLMFFLSKEILAEVARLQVWPEIQSYSHNIHLLVAEIATVR